MGTACIPGDVVPFFDNSVKEVGNAIGKVGEAFCASANLAKFICHPHELWWADDFDVLILRGK